MAPRHPSAYSRLFSALFLLFFVSLPSRVHGQMVPAVYVFGDSLLDVGNNNRLPTVLRADFRHNGVDYPGGKATGRFSNGKNAADFLAENLGLRTSPPYLSLGSNDVDAFLKGVSFASGGAGILSTTNKDRCLTLDNQIELFSSVCGSLVQQLGDVETQKHLSRSIVVVVIGSNDLLEYFTSDASERARTTPQQFVDSLVSTLSGQLRRIYNLGARKIAFAGAPPVGCCPSQRLRNGGDCNVESNDGSVKYNEGVSSLLQGMQSELDDMSYSFFDSYAAVMEYLQNPAGYGINTYTSIALPLASTLIVSCSRSLALMQSESPALWLRGTKIPLPGRKFQIASSLQMLVPHMREKRVVLEFILCRKT